MPSHHDLRDRGRLLHWQLDERLDPSGQGYAIDDVLALESNLGAPAVGTAPSRSAFLSNFALWQFPDNALRYLQSAVQLPHSYVNGSPLLWHVHFTNEAQITNGQTVIFKAEVSTADRFGVFPTPTTYTSTFTASGTIPANSHLKTTSVSIPGTGLTGSSFVLARIYRDTADTHTGAVLLLGSDYHIRRNRLGSATESPVT